MPISTSNPTLPISPHPILPHFHPTLPHPSHRTPSPPMPHPMPHRVQASHTTPASRQVLGAHRPVVDDSCAKCGVARHGSVHRILRQLHAVNLVESCCRYGPGRHQRGATRVRRHSSGYISTVGTYDTTVSEIPSVSAGCYAHNNE